MHADISFPFARSPNVFLIEIPDASECLKLEAFRTVWGETDEVLCYWDGVLFGQATQGRDGKFARLLPTLDSKRGYPWPSAGAFAGVLSSMLGQFTDLEMWCELDCDQYPVRAAESLEELLVFVDRAVSYCVGYQNECPSFSYRPSIGALELQSSKLAK